MQLEFFLGKTQNTYSSKTITIGIISIFLQKDNFSKVVLHDSSNWTRTKNNLRAGGKFCENCKST